MTGFLYFLALLGAGYACAACCAVPMFSKEDESDAYAEWIAKVAAENIENSRLADLRALSAAAGGVEVEEKRAAA